MKFALNLSEVLDFQLNLWSEAGHAASKKPKSILPLPLDSAQDCKLLLKAELTQKIHKLVRINSQG